VIRGRPSPFSSPTPNPTKPDSLVINTEGVQSWQIAPLTIYVDYENLTRLPEQAPDLCFQIRLEHHPCDPFWLARH